MTLTLVLDWPCIGKLYYSIDWGVTKPYIMPLHIPAWHLVELSIAGLEDWCCFAKRSTGETTTSITITTGNLDETITAKLIPCRDEWGCTPSYRNYDALLAKANCLCSSLGIELVEAIPGSGRWNYVIYDKCMPEKGNEFGFHVIATVTDPNYLLQTIECLCEHKLSSSEYIEGYVPPMPAPTPPKDPVDPEKK